MNDSSERSPRRILARFLAAYLVASLVGAVSLFGAGGGHADVPLTTWPGYLLLVPVAPAVIVGRLAPPIQLRDVVGAGAFVLGFGLVWVSTRRISKPGAGTEPRSEREEHLT